MGFIENAIKDMTKGMIESGLADMFNDVNNSLTTVTTDIGKTPAEWNGSIFNIIHSLSENVILPVAGIILTFVLGYEIVTMVVNSNNMHDFDISNMIKRYRIIRKRIQYFIVIEASNTRVLNS